MTLSIIIPCLNESKTIHDTADRLLSYLKEHNIDSEILFVDDGSKDNTKDVIESIPDVISLSYFPNRGKGGAIKYGIEHSKGDYVIFMDADLSTDLEAIERFIPLLKENDIVIGSRHLKESNLKIKQPFFRRFIGFCCRLIVSIVLNWRIKDTQCGFKGMPRNRALEFANKQKINGFAFDVEYLYICKVNHYKIKEVGVIWSDDRGSTVSPIRSSLSFLKDIFIIRKNKKWYMENKND